MQNDQKIIRLQSHDRFRSGYIKDNVVREKAAKAEPELSPEQQEALRIQEERQARWARTIHRHAIEREIRRRYARVNKLTRMEAGIMGVLLGIFLAACSFFLYQEAAVTEAVRTNNSLRSQYLELLHYNDVLGNTIEMGISQDEIYDYATEELGMSYPEKSQIVTYKRGEGALVRQAGGIPGGSFGE